MTEFSPNKLLTCPEVAACMGWSLRGGPISLDRRFSSLSGAMRWSAYAAVCRVGRLSKYTPSGV